MTTLAMLLVLLISQAMVDVCSDGGWLGSSLAVINTIQSIMQVCEGVVHDTIKSVGLVARLLVSFMYALTEDAFSCKLEIPYFPTGQ